MTVADLPRGSVLWYGDIIVGIVGDPALSIFSECACIKVYGNPFDYELIEQEFTQEQSDFIESCSDEDED